MIHPKLLAGLFVQPCTSATRPAEENVSVPELVVTDWEALTVGAKSPPGVVHGAVLKKRAVHVASPVVAGAPPPSPIGALDVPSPQSASSRCSRTVFLLEARGVLR